MKQTLMVGVLVFNRLSIRPYLDRDFDDYAQTLLRTLPCKNMNEARENVEIILKRVKEREELWVAVLDEQAVGFALLDFTSVWGRNGESYEDEGVCVDWLDVHPAFQRKGIGLALIRKAEERGRERLLSRIFMHTSVDNAAMLCLSEKSAFSVARRLVLRWGDTDKDGVLLEKELS